MVTRRWPDPNLFRAGRKPGEKRRVSVLGVTGSIGKSTVDLLARHADHFAVEALTAGRNVSSLAETARRLNARIAVIADPTGYAGLKAALAGTDIEAAAGPEALVQAASRPADIVIAAIVGAAGLAPTLAAAQAGSTIALANKEALVCAGEIFMAVVEGSGGMVLPVDSEHNAVFQALETRNFSEVERIILTASGGPFLGWSKTQMALAKPSEALAHPNWSMGEKVTIDSATLMNKGLEVIEAHHLFGLSPSQIDVVVHPQSVIHGMVAYRDGSTIAQLSVPDMRVPLSHCLWWPARTAEPYPRLDLAVVGKLTFERPDPHRFPSLALARWALDAGGWATNILNAANEIAVAAFLRGQIGYLDIVPVAENVLGRAEAGGLSRPIGALSDALALDAEGRRLANAAVAGELAH